MTPFLVMVFALISLSAFSTSIFSLQESDFQESDLQESDLQESDLQESDLQESDLQERNCSDERWAACIDPALNRTDQGSTAYCVDSKNALKCVRNMVEDCLDSLRLVHRLADFNYIQLAETIKALCPQPIAN